MSRLSRSFFAQPRGRSVTGTPSETERAASGPPGPPGHSVRAAEDDPLAVGRRLAAPDAGAGLRLPLEQDAAGRGLGQVLDPLLAALRAAAQGAGPAGRHRLGEVIPVVGGERVL